MLCLADGVEAPGRPQRQPQDRVGGPVELEGRELARVVDSRILEVGVWVRAQRGDEQWRGGSVVSEPPTTSNVGARARAARERACRLCRRSRTQRERAALAVDAMASMLLETPAPLGDRGDRFALRLARVPQAVPLARRHLGRWLERNEVDAAEAFDITLACSEACANAVEHPVRARRQAFELAAARHANSVELTIRDYGAWDTSRSARTRGRGLRMIERLMDEVAVRPGALGARVVMRKALSHGN
jgi:anti-sigma regulatory factor (Ser/Thr protein kinase)